MSNGNNDDGSFSEYSKVIAEKILGQSNLWFNNDNTIKLHKETIIKLIQKAVSEVERDLY